MSIESTTGNIAKALRVCFEKTCACSECPFEHEDCGDIEQLAADRLEQQEQRITELERELAAAKEDMNKVGNCTICAKNCKPSEIVAIVGNGEKCFEWRGAREGEGK